MKKNRYILAVVILALAEVLAVACLQVRRQNACSTSRPLVVLCIGNSFSVDAVEQELLPVANACGVEMTVYNLYIGGCSLERHAMNVRGDSALYSCRLMRRTWDGEASSVERVVMDSVSVAEVMGWGNWDVITMQQASHYSGQWSTYEPWLTELIDSVRLHMPGHTKLYWYMTWAYQQDATHPAFVPNYNGDQAYMYDLIVGCNRQVLKNHRFDGFIPGGAAIQAARATRLGDTLCRDGYHLSYTCGRYLMACLWLEVLTGKSALGCKYMPEGMTAEERYITQQVAHRVARQGAKGLK